MKSNEPIVTGLRFNLKSYGDWPPVEFESISFRKVQDR
jgi:hypothetical protein